CFLGVPIMIGGKSKGVMAVLHYDRENVYSRRDQEILEVAARQVAVAFENARLFAAEQKRTRYLAFVNALSKTAISAQSVDEMLPAIAKQIKENLEFDHIGIGIVDYNSKEIEI